MVCDALAGDAKFSIERLGSVAEVAHRGRKLMLLKPATYMNLSGRAVAYYMQQLGLRLPNLLIITDDVALPFGTLRIKPKGSPGGHNGLKSIEASLGTADYARLRLGVGSNYAQGQQADYVLAPFARDEQAQLPTVLSAAADAVRHYTFHGLQNAMNQFNKNVLADLGHA